MNSLTKVVPENEFYTPDRTKVLSSHGRWVKADGKVGKATIASRELAIRYNTEVAQKATLALDARIRANEAIPRGERKRTEVARLALDNAEKARLLIAQGVARAEQMAAPVGEEVKYTKKVNNEPRRGAYNQYTYNTGSRDTPKDKFIAELVQRRTEAGAAARGMDIKFRDAETGDVKWRVIHGVTPLANESAASLASRNAFFIAQQIEKLSNDSSLVGSDSIGVSHELDTQDYNFRTAFEPEGGAASFKNRSAPRLSRSGHYTVRDYACAEGDCLLAILHALSKANLSATFGTLKAIKMARVRSVLALGPNPIQVANVEHFDRLARAFEITIRLHFDTHRQGPREFLDATENLCRVNTEHHLERVHMLDPEHQVVDILFEDRGGVGHYSHIDGFMPIAVCPITGDVLAGPRDPRDTQRRVIQQGRTWLQPAKDRNAHQAYKKKVLVYDFETVIDPARDDNARTYSCAWLVYDQAKAAEEDFVPDFSEHHCNIHYGALDECTEVLLRFITETPTTPSDVVYTLVSFNGSRFDNFFLAQEAARRGVLETLMWTSGSIREMEMTTRKHKTLDLCRLCPSSLAAACASFKTSPVKMAGYDHNIIQKAFYKGGLQGLNAWFEEVGPSGLTNREQATIYNMTDVRATASLAVKLCKAFKAMTGIDWFVSFPYETSQEYIPEKKTPFPFRRSESDFYLIWITCH